MEDYCTEGPGKIITEDEITDPNGPGKCGSPYSERTIAGYGGREPDGYKTNFYCVVPWFEGVENSWNDRYGRLYWEKKYDGNWFPAY